MATGKPEDNAVIVALTNLQVHTPTHVKLLPLCSRILDGLTLTASNQYTGITHACFCHLLVWLLEVMHYLHQWNGCIYTMLSDGHEYTVQVSGGCMGRRAIDRARVPLPPFPPHTPPSPNLWFAKVDYFSYPTMVCVHICNNAISFFSGPGKL